MFPHQSGFTVAVGVLVMVMHASAQDTRENPKPKNKASEVKRQLVEKEDRELDAEHREAEKRVQKDAEILDAEADAELQRQKTDAQAEPDDGVVRSIDTVPVKSDDRERYEEFYRRYKGDHVFRTPRLRAKLELTDDQADQLDEYEIDWDAEVDRIREGFSKDRRGGMRDLKHARHEMEERVWKLHTPGQQQTWVALIGETDAVPDELYTTRPRPQVGAEQQLTIRVSEVLNQTVTIQDDHDAGEIVDLVIGERGPIYAVASYNEQYYAIPYPALTTVSGAPGFFVDLSPAAFGQLPFFTATTFPNFFTTEFQKTAFDTFGVTADSSFGAPIGSPRSFGPPIGSPRSFGPPIGTEGNTPADTNDGTSGAPTASQNDPQRNPRRAVGERPSPLDRAVRPNPRRGEEENRDPPNAPRDRTTRKPSPDEKRPRTPEEAHPGKQPFHPTPNPGAPRPGAGNPKPQPTTPMPRQPAQPKPKAGAPGGK